MDKDTKKGKEKWNKFKEENGYKAKNVWDHLSDQEKKEAFAFSEGYKKFLDTAKTERESVREIVRMAEEAGFVSLDEVRKSSKKLRPGNKVYAVSKEKNVALIVVGQEPLWDGINVVGSHVDAPRLDLKPLPLYEDQGIALLKTHYYGGIKKYHWLSHPLALHGVVFKETGEKIEIRIGDKDEDPIFLITDLLPHLAKDQMQKKLTEAVSGEALNILTGTLPVEEKEVSERVKLAILEMLKIQYDMTEEDFTSAELELVPATPARDIGLDRSMVGAYGQDDRICAYTSLRAILNCASPKRTAMALFVDKEEIGSTGNTGMKARFFENVVAEILYLISGDYNDLYCRRALANSRAISADVGAAVDPNWDGVHDKLNAARLGSGVVITKYTGSGGKYSTSDANPEFVADIRRIFNQSKIIWQTGELGKVDQGGGGTIAQYIAKYGMEVLDCGPALLSMHAPIEVAHKGDIYMTFKAYEAFMK